MNRTVQALALAGAFEGAWAFQSFGVEYFGIGIASWLLALWAMVPLPLVLRSARQLACERLAGAFVATGMALALGIAFALHFDAIRVFATGHEPLAGAAIFVAPFYQYPVLLIAVSLAWFVRADREHDGEDAQEATAQQC